MANFFNVQLSIKRHAGKDKPMDPVYFKVDGGRFDAEKTLKLNTESTYTFSFTVKPGHTLMAVTIEGGNISFKEEKKDESKAVYTADWSTAGLPQNKRGNRKVIPVIAELADIGSVTINLQVKLYPEKETQHAHWGTVVSYIDLECKQPEGSSYIDIIKETYR